MDGDSIYIASELRLRSLFFVEVGAAIIVESTIVPFFRISPFAASCSTTCEKSFSCSSFFEMAVFFLQRLGLSFIDHHNILAVTAVSFFCILPEKIRSPA
jgi:hypothetical protein